jgi:hypothetical protein
MTIHETQELSDAVKLHSRVFQAGTQRRNVANFRFAAELARRGRLGKIHTVHASILRLVPDLAPLPAEPEPDSAVIDWDRWLGPAPLRPYNKKYVEGRWRGHYAFHGGAGLPEWGATPSTSASGRRTRMAPRRSSSRARGALSSKAAMPAG